ncbi:type I polyketide synthase [Peribacillus sp. NPDC096448]|uniref:type I polyketide synthase n=1 Tax=Peribacillus sp. NPDC096448 TaxID=3364395 RepID=UPI003809CA24
MKGKQMSLNVRTSSDIKKWLIEEIAARLELVPEEIETGEPFINFGLDSAEAVMLSGDLAEWLGQEVSPTIFWDFPCIEELAISLSNGDNEDCKINFTADKKVQISKEPIAIVGIGCRFPRAKNPREFWDLLKEGKDAISDFPIERLKLINQYKGEHFGIRRGGYVENIELFDYSFFKITKREATRMDPQQRMLLEVTWEAFEDAGINPEKIRGTKTGVFIGTSNSDYGRMQITQSQDPHIYAVTGTALSIAANRISYFFDLHGPSMAIDTACSSSLVAIHYACQSIWQGDSTLAVVGGANLILSPEITSSFANAGMLAGDDCCKTFDARADGYVRGEGVGVVILKSFSQAICDEDDIYAVIHGSAVNQDGRTNGLTAPNQQSQEEVLLAAYKNAGISPTDVDYIEAHGTGTYLGDPIEAKALGKVLSQGRNAENYCCLGSVKTNIGHLESAAGIAGLIKVALSIKHKQIPPHLNFAEPNPNIPFEELLLQVPTKLQSWPDVNKNIAGISSFGFGGTNAHVVLGGIFPGNSCTFLDQTTSDQPVLFPLSAKGRDALVTIASRMRDYLLYSSAEEERLEDISSTLIHQRKHHETRLAVVGRSKEEVAKKLEEYVKNKMIENLDNSKEVVFVFPTRMPIWSQDKDFWILQEAVFRESLIETDRLIQKQVGYSIWNQLFVNRNTTWEGSSEQLKFTLFALQVALVDLWNYWGINPVSFIGIGLGEISGSYATGLLTLQEAIHRVLSMDDRAVHSDYVSLSVEQQLQTWVSKRDAIYLEISPEPLLDQENMVDRLEGKSALLLRCSFQDKTVMLESLGHLYTRGYPIETISLNQKRRANVHLPEYAWQSTKCWFGI